MFHRIGVRSHTPSGRCGLSGDLGSALRRLAGGPCLGAAGGLVLIGHRGQHLVLVVRDFAGRHVDHQLGELRGVPRSLRRLHDGLRLLSECTHCIGTVKCRKCPSGNDMQSGSARSTSPKLLLDRYLHIRAVGSTVISVDDGRLGRIPIEAATVSPHTPPSTQIAWRNSDGASPTTIARNISTSRPRVLAAAWSTARNGFSWRRSRRTSSISCGRATTTRLKPPLQGLELVAPDYRRLPPRELAEGVASGRRRRSGRRTTRLDVTAAGAQEAGRDRGGMIQAASSRRSGRAAGASVSPGEYSRITR